MWVILSGSWLIFEFGVKRQNRNSLIGLGQISLCFEIFTLLLFLINPRPEKGGTPDFCQLSRATRRKVVGIQNHDVNHFHSLLCSFSVK